MTDEVVAAQLSYWRDQLAAAPPLELPSDRPRPAVRSQAGRIHELTLPVPLRDAAHQIALRASATPFMVLLGAFQVLLWHYSGQRDFSVGTPIASRTRPEVEPLIGFFVNTLVLRADLSGDPSFLELLSRVRDTALGAYAHQELPFEQLIDELAPSRALNRSPLFQVLFALQNAPMRAPHLEGLDISVVPIATDTAKFDLTLSLTETPGGLDGQLEYSTDLFEPATIARMVDHYRALLEAIAADPTRPIGALPALAPDERRRLLDAASPAPAEPDAARHAEPTATEQALREIWQQVLELPSIGLYDSFFALGGNSLLSVLLLAQIQDSFGVELPVRVLFASPTITAVAAYLDQARRTAAPSGAPSAAGSLLPFRTTGARPPLFFVHAISGMAVAFQQLAEHLGDDQPFYALHAVGVDDDAAPSTDIPEMAGRYLEAIRSVQPQGPYQLGGWSFGGLVALEMAHQLRTAGQPVAMLALVDTWALGPDAYRLDEVTIFDTLLRELEVEIARDELEALAPEARVRRVAALAAASWRVQVESAERRIRRLTRVIAAHLEAASRYVPPRYPDPVTVLRAQESLTAVLAEQIERDPSCGWRTRAGLTARVHVVPGNHFTLIRPPHVGVLAALLRRAMSQAS